MKIYNTLTRKIEEFIPNEKGIVKMYTCGPTVYNYAHIGNYRTYIAEDILEKAFKYFGYDVKRVMNITDVGHLSSDSDDGDDKMVTASINEGKSVYQLAEFYTKAFFDDCKLLNINKPDTVIKATSMIDDYFKIIKDLMDKGFAYKAGGNIYFDTSKLDDYYALTNHKIDDMVVGVREGVSEDSNKRNQADFVLWFTKSKFQNQELKWESPWGIGYPGWHIECSTIAIKELGERIDIHCGGVDNIFPHHTNEIAQSEAYLGHKWCSYWFHVEHLNDKSGKISKSTGGSFLGLKYLASLGYDPLAYRFMCLNSHYRKQLVFSYDSLDNTSLSYKKLKTRCLALSSSGKISSKIDSYKEMFDNYLGDDLNTASTISLLFDVLKSDLNDAEKKHLISLFDEVLSLDLFKPYEVKVDKDFERYILDKIDERKKAKEVKDFAKADAIRDELLAKNVKITDTLEGTSYEVL